MFVVNLDFDAKRGAHVAALDDSTSNPDVAREVDSLEWIVKRVRAGIANEWMRGGMIVVLVTKDIEIANIFQLAVAVRSLAGKRPIAIPKVSRAGRKPDDRGPYVFAGGEIANEEIGGRPGLGQLGKIGDHRMSLIGMRK